MPMVMPAAPRIGSALYRPVRVVICPAISEVTITPTIIGHEQQAADGRRGALHGLLVQRQERDRAEHGQAEPGS